MFQSHGLSPEIALLPEIVHPQAIAVRAKVELGRSLVGPRRPRNAGRTGTPPLR